MTDLTTWLLEQIEADEVVARPAAIDARGQVPQGIHPDYLKHINQQSPAATLRRCAALREAIEDAWGDHERIEGEWGMCRSRERMEADGDYPDVVTSLAAMFSDRAGYAEAVGL